ncbi:chorismate mutase [Paenibacillus sp. N1-5-1-14]|uniref:chorismate mutase n=1 Tax=Paenibacillus radicibacter TaxID=2972488 RepID=UPI0021596B4B|nr:chorismate mutase [Paenibacillus radicibacter]MCR8642285.1 chorismate mutase [Paenibacillus radicibacter]
MVVRGIRGATTVEYNDADEMLTATNELLNEIVKNNNTDPKDIASVFITVTSDLNATFPARAIRSMEGWELVPLMCSVEIEVDHALAQCIRLMVMVNTTKEQHEIHHAYLNGATVLRPDLLK